MLFRSYKIIKFNDYVENPKDSGYRSIHYVYKYSSKADKYNGLKIELQIRTKLQHNWATAVETAGAMTRTSPTAEIVARLQKLCADLMAAQTGAPPRFFAAADLPARPLPLPALAKWWGQLAQAARSAEHPLNAGLTLEYLASSAQQALNSHARATN